MSLSNFKLKSLKDKLEAESKEIEKTENKVASDSSSKESKKSKKK